MAVYRIAIVGVVGLMLVLGGEVRWGGLFAGRTYAHACTYPRTHAAHIYIRTHRLAGVDRTGGEERRGEGSGI